MGMVDTMNSGQNILKKRKMKGPTLSTDDIPVTDDAV